MQKQRIYQTTVLVGLLLIGQPETVHAYVDPGTGALMLQAAIAGVLGVVFFFRQTALKLISFLRSKPVDTDDDHAG